MRSSLPSPDARRDDVIDLYHGVPVPDPYRWLEDPDSPETTRWVDAQIARTEDALGGPVRDGFRARLREVYAYARYGPPERHGSSWFRFHNDGLRPHAALLRSGSPEEPGEVVLDPTTFSEDGTIGLASHDIDGEARLLAYAVSHGGSDWSTVHVRDLATGRDLPDEVRWLKFCRPTFLPVAARPDGRAAFLYARYPAPDESTARHANHEVWLHLVGTHQDEDVRVLAFPDEPEWSLYPRLVDDGPWLVFEVGPPAGDRNALYVARTGPEHGPTGIGPVRPLVAGFEALVLPITVCDGALVAFTDAHAPRGRVVAIDLDGAAPWRELVPETDDNLLGVTRVGDRLLLRYLHHAHTRVVVHDVHTGARLGEVPLPGIGTAEGFDGRPGDEVTWFVFTSYVHPTSVYRLDVPSLAVTATFTPTVPFATSDLHVEQVFVDRPDGARIPAFVCWKGALVRDGSRPTLLYGYGGFNVPLVPAFDTALVPWLERGGVYVSANLRGGGEYGRAWHQAGTRERKPAVFADFVAVADHLVATGVTRRDKLAIWGHSNGGLLVGATLVAHPERFGAAIPAVGVLDMLRYQHFTIGRAWADDYGTSEDPDLFATLLGYSPLHNARPARYPPTLIVTADHDDRVVPAHSFKFGAALQWAQRGEAPVLLRIERRAGHGAAKPLGKVIDERADIYTFLASALEVEVSGDGLPPPGAQGGGNKPRFARALAPGGSGFPPPGAQGGGNKPRFARALAPDGPGFGALRA